MKNTFKNKKLLIGTVSVILVAAITLCGMLIAKNGRKEKPTDETEPPTSSQVQIDDITEPTVLDITEPPETEAKNEIEPDESGLTPAVSEIPTPETSKPTEKVDEPAKPVSEAPAEPKKEPEPSIGGIIIGDGGKAEPYHCGAENHHCDGPETHAFIQNLELEGCPTCGSHACPSFYALDEWGQTTYKPSKCPQYNIQKDPVHYCQVCGKKCGDGTNGTCVTFNVDIECQNCGKHVKAWECHYCD